MKTIAVLLLLVTGFGCIKEEGEECEEKDPKKISGITGKWELRKSEGGIAGTINYAAGNGTTYQFRLDGTYQYYLAGSTNIQSGTYTLEFVGDLTLWKLFLTTGSTTTERLIRIGGFDLVFLKEAECCDYPDVYFSRV